MKKSATRERERERERGRDQCKDCCCLKKIQKLQCCGTRMFIPDPKFFHPESEFFRPGSRICIKEFKYFNPKNGFKAHRVVHPGSGSRFFTHSGSRGQKGTGSRIRNTEKLSICRVQCRGAENISFGCGSMKLHIRIVSPGSG